MMSALLLYLLQMQPALLLLLAVYYGLLRWLTLHQLNRLYLLAALGVAALYPALNLSGLLPRAATSAAPLALLVPAWATAGYAAHTTTTIGSNYGAWLLVLHWAGAGLLVLQPLLQPASLWQPHRAARATEAGGVRFRTVEEELSPFSFGQTIYLNPTRHAPAELLLVLLHEQVRVRQGHTLDVLLGHLHRALVWWSPAAWLWLRAPRKTWSSSSMPPCCAKASCRPSTISTAWCS